MPHSPINSKIAVAVSGGGRSLENLLRLQQEYGYSVEAVIASCPDCRAVEIAKNANLDVFVGDFSTSEISDVLFDWIEERAIGLVVLAGFLKRFPTPKNWNNQIINIHPSLLPKHGGKGMYGSNVHKAVVANGDSQSGATVHFVNQVYDDGKIISQITVILPKQRPQNPWPQKYLQPSAHFCRRLSKI